MVCWRPGCLCFLCERGRLNYYEVTAHAGKGALSERESSKGFFI